MSVQRNGILLKQPKQNQGMGIFTCVVCYPAGENTDSEDGQYLQRNRTPKGGNEKQQEKAHHLHGKAE